MSVNKLKNLDIDKATKISVIAGILLISVSFFYYYVIFLPQKEQARLEQQRQEQSAKEEKERQAIERELQERKEAKQNLDACIDNAKTRYSNRWEEECEARGKLTSKCISLLKMTFKEYQEEKGIEGLEGFVAYYEEQDECSCSLPFSIADRINETLQEDKDYCFKMYPQK